MKKKPNPILEDILQKLQLHGPITARAMFGGQGIYYNKVIFASIFMDQLYFRVDEYNRSDYEPYNSLPFIYEGGGKRIVLPYLLLPTEIFENPTLLPAWIQKSYEASLRHKLKKTKKTKNFSDF